MNRHVSIQKQIRPALIKYYENESASNPSKCNEVRGCPVWFKSESSLLPTLSVIGNISKSTAILMLNGENDSATPVQQAFLLQQRLTEIDHPDHKLITYPDLGHVFYPSSQWSTGIGPIQQNVLADLYSWLATHSGFTNHATAPRACLLLLYHHPLTLLLNKIISRITRARSWAKIIHVSPKNCTRDTRDSFDFYYYFPFSYLFYTSLDSSLELKITRLSCMHCLLKRKMYVTTFQHCHCLLNDGLSISSVKTPVVPETNLLRV